MQLQVHPHSSPGPVRSLEVRGSRGAHGQLRFRWKLTADLSQLRVPPLASPARADRLWEHTCFEVFLSPSGSRHYRELNFSPSGAWAAYSFSGYREDMTPLVLPRPPEAHWSRAPGFLELSVRLDLDDLLPDAAGVPVRCSMAAVVEDTGWRLSYWALAHPPGEPDFHNRQGFWLKLSPPRSRTSTQKILRPDFSPEPPESQ
jgi:hypothetical protein